MSKPKILKGDVVFCNLKDEDDCRVRDSHIKQLDYYTGHIELVKDKIGLVHLNKTDKDEEVDTTLNDVLHNSLDIRCCEINNILACGGILHLFEGATILKQLVVKNKYSSIRNEAYVADALVDEQGEFSIRHGFVRQMTVDGRCFVHERAVVGSLTVRKGGLFQSGYRLGSILSVPVIHELIASDGATIQFRGDCSVGVLRLRPGVRIKRQRIATVSIGKVFVGNKQIDNVSEWLEQHTCEHV